jgi:hypothetical protein
MKGDGSEMKRISLILMLLILASGLAFAGEKKAERYSAVAMVTGGRASTASVRLDLRIDEYTSDEKIQELLEVFIEGGNKALRRELEKIKVGRVAPAAGLGVDVAVARVRKTENGKLIRVVTARPMPFWELTGQGRPRTTEYPLGWLEFELDDHGNPGKGVVLIAARLWFNKEGSIDIEYYGGLQNLKLLNVRQED